MASAPRTPRKRHHSREAELPDAKVEAAALAGRLGELQPPSAQLALLAEQVLPQLHHQEGAVAGGSPSRL